MADHNVKLMYASNGFSANPPTIRVRAGQTIGFALADGSAQGKIRIRFHDRQFFATGKAHFNQDGIFLGGDGDVRVTGRPNARTTFHCELLNDNDEIILQSNETEGGEILPDT